MRKLISLVLGLAVSATLLGCGDKGGGSGGGGDASTAKTAGGGPAGGDAAKPAGGGAAFDPSSPVGTWTANLSAMAAMMKPAMVGPFGQALPG